MINPVVYADLKRIIRIFRCDGMTEAAVIQRVCWILNGLVDDFDDGFDDGDE